MWKVTWKGLLAHKLRFVLTSLAVVLGVAFMSGTMTLTATLSQVFDDLFADVNEGVDVYVRGREPFDADFFTPPREPVPAALLDTIRSVEGVADAQPGVEVPYAQIVGANGEEIGNPGSGPPTFGFTWDDNTELNPFRLDAGRPPGADNEIVIDRGSADDGDIRVGDTVSVLTQKPAKDYEVVGIAKFGSADSPAGASIVLFTLAEAQRINDFTDEFSAISVVAEPGLTQQQARDRVAAAVYSSAGSTGVDVITGEQLTKENQDDFKENISFFNTALLVFAFVALIVGSFIIYNTFTITIAQRMREMALLRAIGSSTRQVMSTVIGEAVAVGLFASAVGLGLGIVLSAGLKAAFNAFGFDIPGGPVVVTPSTIVWSFVVGTTITVASAVLPARRAGRVPPVAAMRDVAIEQTTHFGRRAVIGIGIVALGVTLLLYGLFGDVDGGIRYVGFGAFAIFIGVFVLGPIIAVPISRAIGSPLPYVKGVTGILARENALRNPRRTSATAAALMIGVALVGFITIFAASANKSIAYAIDQQLKTDFLVTSGAGFGGIGFSPAVAEELSKLPELSAVSPLRFNVVLVDGEQEFITAVDPVPIEQLADFGSRAGSIAGLTDDGVAISRRYADDHDLGLGDTINVLFPKTQMVPVRVEAIYERREIADDFMITLGSYDKNFLPQQQLDFLVMAKIAPGVDPDQARAAMEQALEPYPIAKVRDNAQYKDDQKAQINQLVAFIYVMLLLSVIIAVIGIIITLLLSVYERTHEIGLLRAVGMTRSQMRSTVRWESVIVALLGTMLGLGIGLFFGWAIFAALRDEGFTQFAVAPFQLLIVVVIAAMVGVLAAAYPAWRAARLDVLRAIATE